MHFTPVMKRIALTKLLGALVGILSAWALSTGGTAPATALWGVAAGYLTLGAVIGLAGFCNRIPIGGIGLPAWLRGTCCGAWFGLVMVLLGHDALAAAVVGIGWLPETFRSPWWMILDAAIAGAVIDILATRGIGRVNWPGSGVGAEG